MLKAIVILSCLRRELNLFFTDKTIFLRHVDMEGGDKNVFPYLICDKTKGLQYSRPYFYSGDFEEYRIALHFAR